MPAVTAWAIALHPLYGRDGAPITNLWPWARDAMGAGGLFTVGYWLPAAFVNGLVLRRPAD